MYSGDRTAVTCTPLHQLKGASALISSVAIDDRCHQVYIGFTDGQIQEHRLHARESNSWLTLTARKHVSNKVIWSRFWRVKQTSQQPQSYSVGSDIMVGKDAAGTI